MVAGCTRYTLAKMFCSSKTTNFQTAFAVVVYHVPIVAFRHGLLKKVWPMVIHMTVTYFKQLDYFKIRKNKMLLILLRISSHIVLMRKIVCSSYMYMPMLLKPNLNNDTNLSYAYINKYF